VAPFRPNVQEVGRQRLMAMRLPLKRFSNSALVTNTLALISGSVLTQALTFVLSPILARIFSLEDFGHLANYNAWVAILALVSCFRYEHAIIIARTSAETNRVLALTAFLCLASTLFYGLCAVAIYASPVPGGYLRDIQPIVLLIPLGVLFICVSSPLTQLNIKRGHFKRLATIGVAQVVVTITAQVSLGVLKLPHGLIFGTVGGYAFASVALSIGSLDRGTLQDLQSAFRPQHLVATAREHMNFPRYTFGADAIGVIAQQFTPVFITALFNPAVAGLYAFSTRVVRVPLIVVGGALASALRSEAPERAVLGTLKPLFSKTVRTLLLLAAGPFLVMLFFSAPIFAFVFGEQWRDAGHIVQILSPGILLEFVAFPVAVFFLVTGTQRYSLRSQLLSVSVLVAGVLIGRHVLGEFIATCYLISAAMVIGNLMTLILGAKVSAQVRAAPVGGVHRVDVVV
jgi:O-antigen/teichoic acid export membrane protein